ncbi:uncharacterized protein LOC122859909 [Aphidius gifuensis]|uniref:uncharacterized protein LOC122859909 n=1 Tax=Aphidius gifuensis TaxID=684658 RepID=UPI001CDBD205|nr:uncharacterized protein LOC122859909 [Aphidius gifuensis]
MDSSSEDECQDGGSEDCIELLDETREEIPKFSLTSTTYTFKIKDVPHNRGLVEFIESAFRQVYERVMSLSSNNTDRIIFNFRSENMTSDSFTNLTPINEFTFDRLWTIISSICQSAGGIDATAAFNIKVIILKRIFGGCGMPKSERSRRGTLIINNKDNLCLPRSIVVKLSELETNKLDVARLKAVRDARYELQKTLTLEFINKSGVVIPPEGYVIVLRMACLKFINLTLKITNVNPFREALTCASLCMRVFQRNYLTKEKIGIVPRSGYRLSDNQSKEALQWLEWLAYSTASNIQHAGNSHEVKIGPKKIRVDGINERRKNIFQYHGCWWHGCIECFMFNRDHVQKDGTTLNERYERTQNITKYLEDQGYDVIEKWGSLNPRDAYFGGRTENFVESYTVQPGETIQYVDFTSLYPSVLKQSAFPLAHPKVYAGRDIEKKFPNNDISKIDGLIKCRVLAPSDLHMPVLPVRSKNKKLYFPLCRTCVDTMEPGFCNHNNDERSLIGTWVSSELKLALTKGYVIEKIYEVWHYDRMSMNNKETNEVGLFTGYINTFLKIKQEASGYPSWVKTESDKDQYIEEYFQAENIKLDKEKIDFNPGLRTLSKNMLNSLYGKLGQRSSLWRKTICSDLQEFYEIVDNEKNLIQFIEPINQETVLISWKLINEEEPLTKTTNVVLAAFTTAYAREKLYSWSKLGDLTDELEEYGEGSYIKSFISGGPKFYSFIVQKPDGGQVEVCKLKGVRLDLEAQKFINFNTVKSLIKREIDPFKIEYNSIRRTRDLQVYSTIDKKMISVTGPKRNHYENITYPLGYKRQRV